MSPRTFSPAPGWSPDGHRIKAPLDYGRGPDKVWVYGALRPCDGQTLTFTAPSRNTTSFLKLLETIDAANPDGELYLINDNLSKQIPVMVARFSLAAGVGGQGDDFRAVDR